MSTIIDTFIEDCKRTESLQFNDIIDTDGNKYNKERVIHGCFGIYTELGEIIKSLTDSISNKKDIDIVNIKEEIGDTLWYIALLNDEFGFNFNMLKGADIKTSNTFLITDIKKENIIDYLMSQTIQAVENSSLFIDMVKKSIFYGKELDIKEIEDLLQFTSIYLVYLSHLIDENLESVMKTVISKLKHRYPDRFTSEKAENRELKEERKILEK